jgi:hypothetical protein
MRAAEVRNGPITSSERNSPGRGGKHSPCLREVEGKLASYGREVLSGSAGESLLFLDAAPVPRDRFRSLIPPRTASRPKPMECQLSNTKVQADEVPSEPLCFLLGRDHDGHWIVRETHGLCGGLFANENAATRYAKFESAGRRITIRLVPDTIELNCSCREPRAPRA